MLKECPFTRESQLCNELDENLSSVNDRIATSKSVPGHPSVKLDKHVDVIACLEQECLAPDLEQLAPHLWMMSTQSSRNINALHRQRVKGRDIVVTEDPRLHLTWIHDRIFIKPIPRFLLSYVFWVRILLCDEPMCSSPLNPIREATLGYLRTYRYLIRHETDLRIAQKDELRLVPSDVDWPTICTFLENLECIVDSDVSGRYQYGELRLSRLNFYAPFFLRKFYFEQLHGQYSDIFGRFFGVILFGFAIMSTLLNAMQVEMAVEQLTENHWMTFWQFARWSSILVLTVVSLISSGLCIFWIWMVTDEWVFALRSRRAKRQQRQSHTKTGQE